LKEALNEGAEGIQVGTAFAFCEESGMDPSIRSRVMQQSLEHRTKVFTDPLASPTGFPFKVLNLDGTLSDQSTYSERTRICDLGYLRELYRKENGKVGYRCPGEPVEDYVAKGGEASDAIGRKCVCNGLLATIGLGQIRRGAIEPALVTAGDDVANIARFLRPGRTTYSADDVLDDILGSLRC
jgi:nitronate monooxygenase